MSRIFSINKTRWFQKYFVCSPLFGEMILFDWYFSNGWFNHQLENLTLKNLACQLPRRMECLVFQAWCPKSKGFFGLRIVFLDMQLEVIPQDSRHLVFNSMRCCGVAVWQNVISIGLVATHCCWLIWELCFFWRKRFDKNSPQTWPQFALLWTSVEIWQFFVFHHRSSGWIQVR